MDGRKNSSDLTVIPCVPAHMRVLDSQDCLFGELLRFLVRLTRCIPQNPIGTSGAWTRDLGALTSGSLKGAFAGCSTGPTGECVFKPESQLCSPSGQKRLNISIKVLV